MTFSPSLADKVAGDTSRLSNLALALGIIEIARPDIFNNLQRRALFRKMQEKAEVKNIPLSNLLEGPIRHTTLPPALLTRIHIINQVFAEVFQPSLEKTVNNFRRDLFPEKEVEVWERMAAAYLNLTKDHELTLEQKKEVFEALLLASFDQLTEQEFSKFHYVTYQMIADEWKNVVSQTTDKE